MPYRFERDSGLRFAGRVASFVVIVGAGAGLLYLAAEAWKQTCLGIFEDRELCEARRQTQAVGRQCLDRAWTTCQPISDERGNHDQAYTTCVQHAAQRCLASRCEDPDNF